MNAEQRRVVLQIGHVAIQEAIGKERLLLAKSQTQLYADYSHTLQSLVASLCAYLAMSEQRREQIETVRYPNGWWQAFKADYEKRWWLRWFVRRRPVVFAERKIVTVYVVRMCQHLPITEEQAKRGHIEYLLWEGQ